VSQISFVSNDERLPELFKTAGIKAARLTEAEAKTLGRTSDAPAVLVLDVRPHHQIAPWINDVQKKQPNLAIVVIVSTLDARFILEAMRAGIKECLPEPITPQALDEAVRRLVVGEQRERAGHVVAFIGANPQLFEGATGEHADAVVRQLQLELTYINDPNISPDAARASIDNILDIIDIVQSDPKLADMATQDGISGFSPLPAAANPAPTPLENDVQTVFAANFIAQSNSLGQQAIDLVGSGDTKAIAALIDDLKAFEKFVTDFDAARGGNALLDATGALGAEVAAMIKGLQTGNTALVTAAADQMHGNAADVGGSNVPVAGGHYNTDGVTIAEVLGAAPVAETPAPTAAAAAAEVHQVAAPAISVEPVTLATADVTIGVEDHASSGMPDLAHQLHHTWG